MSEVSPVKQLIRRFEAGCLPPRNCVAAKPIWRKLAAKASKQQLLAWADQVDDGKPFVENSDQVSDKPIGGHAPVHYCPSQLQDDEPFVVPKLFYNLLLRPRIEVRQSPCLVWSWAPKAMLRQEPLASTLKIAEAPEAMAILEGGNKNGQVSVKLAVCEGVPPDAMLPVAGEGVLTLPVLPPGQGSTSAAGTTVAECVPAVVSLGTMTLDEHLDGLAASACCSSSKVKFARRLVTECFIFKHSLNFEEVKYRALKPAAQEGVSACWDVAMTFSIKEMRRTFKVFRDESQSALLKG